MNKVIVIGGGASGMTAAIAAARNGAEITVLEQNDRIGKKILSTGNGRCNLTNHTILENCYYGDDKELIHQVLQSFHVQEADLYFESLGIFTKSRGDYIYPLNDQASAVRDALELEAKQLGIKVITGISVSKIQKKSNIFFVYGSNKTERFSGDCVILACGSKASQVSGSDGSGYALAKSLGHSLSTVVPALTALRTNEKYFRRLAGIRTTAEVTLLVEGASTAKDCGEVQFTDYGISGIPVFQISRHAAKALEKGQSVSVKLDLVPTMSCAVFTEKMRKRREHYSKRTAEACFNSLLPGKLTPVLLELCGIDRMLWTHKITDDKWNRMLRLCKEFEVKILAVNGFEKAQVCAGGVRTDELDPHTMESKKCSGLYITGELLDVDGICGGYNLHFAWATGLIAGKAAAEKECI